MKKYEVLKEYYPEFISLDKLSWIWLGVAVP
jgi:hypothetical protein